MQPSARDPASNQYKLLRTKVIIAPSRETLAPGAALVGNTGRTHNKTNDASKQYVTSTKNLVPKFGVGSGYRSWGKVLKEYNLHKQRRTRTTRTQKWDDGRQYNGLGTLICPTPTHAVSQGHPRCRVIPAPKTLSLGEISVWMAPEALREAKGDTGYSRWLNNVFLNIQRREKLLLLKDQRSFTEKETYFLSWEVG